jgi:hypothetical protein
MTASPTPAALLVDRQASSKKYEYPACRNDPNGPCALSDRAKELCIREFATWSNGGFPRQYYCQCTNDFYARSSEYVAYLLRIRLRIERGSSHNHNRCWNGCYGASRTTQDLESISRQSRMQELECESWSLQIESQEARSSFNGFAGNRTSVSPSTTSSEYRIHVSIPTVGATASANVEETAPWVERPSATGQVKQGTSGSTLRQVRWNGLHSIMLILVLSGMIGL